METIMGKDPYHYYYKYRFIARSIQKLKVDIAVDMANYQTKSNGLEILDMLVERITDNFDLEEKIEFKTFCNHIVTRKKPFCLELEELQEYGNTSFKNLY
jgi:hypothetical protein|tara:strand:- start:1798 stop:2097 length:300 start_codon:yes stop_codon:yes gene_type:complete